MKKVIDIYKRIFSDEKPGIRYFIVIACTVLYIGVFAAQIFYLNDKTNMEFTSSPIRTVLMLIMTLTLCRLGYITALILSAAQGIIVAVLLIKKAPGVNLSQLIAIICAMVGISFLYFALKKINSFIYPIIVENSKHAGLVKAARDANIKVKESEKIIGENKKELARLAYYDQLTELPNRIKIKKDMELLIKRQTYFGIIFIGLDNFKAINESKGHDIGDKVLIESAKRISEVIEKGDILGRIGGDEFIIVTLRYSDKEDCEEYARKVAETFSPRFFEDTDKCLYVHASIGITCYPADANNVSDLLRNADIALNKAKHDGKNRFVAFNDQLHTEIEFRNQISMLLPYAIANNELKMVYQPQFFPNKRLRGFEALIRWNSEVLGYVSPVAFIPVAEETGYIIELGQWILKTACKKLKDLTDKYGKSVTMSVNVSAKQFREKDFVKTVAKVLNETGADSSLLELEVTESLLLNSVEDTAFMLNQLKHMNIKVSIDDFGTGYSSLSYLRSLPLDTLKIDKSFIDVVVEDSNGKSIVNSIIHLAHTLGMTVIAEGVEYNEQLDYLKTQACDCIQGFLFSKPLDSEAADLIVENYGVKQTENIKDIAG